MGCGVAVWVGDSCTGEAVGMDGVAVGWRTDRGGGEEDRRMVEVRESEEVEGDGATVSEWLPGGVTADMKKQRKERRAGSDDV